MTLPTRGDGAWTPHTPLPGFRLSPEYLCWMSRIFGWLGWGIVVCAGRAPPGRGTSPRATIFSLDVV